jgi:hypothetical protein
MVLKGLENLKACVTQAVIAYIKNIHFVGIEPLPLRSIASPLISYPWTATEKGKFNPNVIKF